MLRGGSRFSDSMYNIYWRNIIFKTVCCVEYKTQVERRKLDMPINKQMAVLYTVNIFVKTQRKAMLKTWCFSPLYSLYQLSVICLKSRGINDWHVFLKALIFYLKYIARLYLTNKINTKGAYIRHYIIRLIYHFS